MTKNALGLRIFSETSQAGLREAHLFKLLAFWELLGSPALLPAALLWGLAWSGPRLAAGVEASIASVRFAESSGIGGCSAKQSNQVRCATKQLLGLGGLYPLGNNLGFNALLEFKISYAAQLSLL